VPVALICGIYYAVSGDVTGTLNRRHSTLSDFAGFQCNACVWKRLAEGAGADITMILKGRDMGRVRRARNAELR